MGYQLHGNKKVTIRETDGWLQLTQEWLCTGLYCIVEYHSGVCAIAGLRHSGSWGLDERIRDVYRPLKGANDAGLGYCHFPVVEREPRTFLTIPRVPCGGGNMAPSAVRKHHPSFPTNLCCRASEIDS